MEKTVTPKKFQSFSYSFCIFRIISRSCSSKRTRPEYFNTVRFWNLRLENIFRVLDKHTNRIADPFNTDVVETTGFNNDARKLISRHILRYEFEKKFQRALFVLFCRRQDHTEITEVTRKPLMLFSSTYFWEKRFSICLCTKNKYLQKSIANGIRFTSPTIK